MSAKKSREPVGRSAGKAKSWSVGEQRRRIRGMLACVRDAVRAYFDVRGRCVIDGQRNHFHLRECIHCCQALFDGDAADAALANAIVDAVPFHPCDFSTLSMIELLLRYPDKVTRSNTAKLRDHIAEEVRSVQKAHNSFVGGNDNFPAMAVAIQVLGGELVGDEGAVDAGVDTLYSLRDLLTRRGFFSEYNSPTYAAVTLHALAETANHARHAEARRLAKHGADRMWLDVAAHWHPGTSFPAGPQSRAYHADSTMLSSHLHTVMWSVFGDVVWPSPLERYFGPQAEARFEHIVHRLGYMHSALAGYAATVHRVGDDIARLAFDKRYPFRARGTAEMGTFHLGDYRENENGAVVHVPGRCVAFGSDDVCLNTYMEKGFAIGTSTRGFLSGTQSEVFFETHRRRPRGRTLADVRSVFVRYLVGPTDLTAEMAAGLIRQHALAWAVQDDTRALALYHPNGDLHRGVTDLRLCVLLPEADAPVDEVWIGDRRLPDRDGESPTADWVILKDGPMLLAFHPLAATDLGRRVAVRSEHVDGLRVISFYNYEGAKRTFARDELPAVRNGFVFEAATTRQYRTAGAFLKALRRAQVSDTVVMATRRVRYLRGRREMLLWLDPRRQSIKAATVNGRQVAYDPLEIDGVDVARVPWLNKGVPYADIDWWQRIADRPGMEGQEGVAGRRVERAPRRKCT